MVVWVNWCTNSLTNSCTATATGYHDPWQIMVSNTIAATTNTIWVSWTTNSCTATNQYISQAQLAQAQAQAMMQQQAMMQAQAQAAYQQPMPTPAELRAIEERREKALEEERQKKVAAAKAMELLRANLSQKQRETLDKNGWFLVEGGKSKKTYRVHGDRCAGNIFELNKAGKEAMRYCVHASYEIPLGDQLLAQALSLRLDEEHLVTRANKTALAA